MTKVYVVAALDFLNVSETILLTTLNKTEAEEYASQFKPENEVWVIEETFTTLDEALAKVNAGKLVFNF